QVNPRVLNQAARDASLDLGAIALDRPQRRLLEFLQQQQVPCLDLLAAFTGEPDTYAVCDTHWNERGNHLAAEVIALWLAQGPRGNGAPPATQPKTTKGKRGKAGS